MIQVNESETTCCRILNREGVTHLSSMSMVLADGTIGAPTRSSSGGFELCGSSISTPGRGGEPQQRLLSLLRSSFLLLAAGPTIKGARGQKCALVLRPPVGEHAAEPIANTSSLARGGTRDFLYEISLRGTPPRIKQNIRRKGMGCRTLLAIAGEA